jgi:hypothetical protein
LNSKPSLLNIINMLLVLSEIFAVSIMSHQALILTNFSINYQNESDDDQLYEINKDTSDFFEDGFSSPWLKPSMVLVYLINCLSNGGLCFVVWFEVTGRAGPYRTLVNKLVSFMIIQVSLYKISFYSSL